MSDEDWRLLAAPPKGPSERTQKIVRLAVDSLFLFFLTALFSILTDHQLLGELNRTITESLAQLSLKELLDVFVASFGAAWNWTFEHKVVILAPVAGFLAGLTMSALAAFIFMGLLGKICAVLTVILVVVCMSLLVRDSDHRDLVSITVGLALTTVLAAVVLLFTVLVGQIIVLVLTVTQNLVQWGTTSLALGFGFLNDTIWDFVKEKTKGWLDERLTEWLLRHWIEPWLKRRAARQILAR
jgi:hypothetical protein